MHHAVYSLEINPTTLPCFPLLISWVMAVCWRPCQPLCTRTHQTPTLSPTHSPSRFLMVGSSHLAVITDQLDSANHLTNSEETEALGEQYAASDGLRLVEVSHPLEDVAGRGSGLLGGLEQGAGVLRLLEQVGEVGLESRNGSAERRPASVNRPDSGTHTALQSLSTYGGVMLWPLKTILESSMPTLE
jgi:hypothetical protein